MTKIKLVPYSSQRDRDIKDVTHYYVYVFSDEYDDSVLVDIIIRDGKQWWNRSKTMVAARRDTIARMVVKNLPITVDVYGG